MKTLLPKIVDELVSLLNESSNIALRKEDVEFSLVNKDDVNSGILVIPSANGRYFEKNTLKLTKGRRDLTKFFNSIPVVVFVNSENGLTVGDIVASISSSYGITLGADEIANVADAVTFAPNTFVSDVTIIAKNSSLGWVGQIVVKAKDVGHDIGRLIGNRALEGLTYPEATNGEALSLALASYPLDFTKACGPALSAKKQGDVITPTLAQAIAKHFNSIYGTTLDQDGALIGAATIEKLGDATTLGFTGHDGKHIAVISEVADLSKKMKGKIHVFFTFGDGDNRVSISDWFAADKNFDGRLMTTGYYDGIVNNYGALFAKGGAFNNPNYDLKKFMSYIPGLLMIKEPETNDEAGWNKFSAELDKIIADCEVKTSYQGNIPVLSLEAKAASTAFKGRIDIFYPEIKAGNVEIISPADMSYAALLNKYKVANPSATFVGGDAATAFMMSVETTQIPLVAAALVEVVVGVNGYTLKVRSDYTWTPANRQISSDLLAGIGTGGFTVTAPATDPALFSAKFNSSMDLSEGLYSLNPALTTLYRGTVPYVRNAEEKGRGSYYYPLGSESDFTAGIDTTIKEMNAFRKSGNPVTNAVLTACRKMATIGKSWLAYVGYKEEWDVCTATLEVNPGRQTVWNPWISDSSLLSISGRNFILNNEVVPVHKGLIPDDLTGFTFETLLSKCTPFYAMLIGQVLFDRTANGVVISPTLENTPEVATGLRTFTNRGDGRQKITVKEVATPTGKVDITTIFQNNLTLTEEVMGKLVNSAVVIRDDCFYPCLIAMLSDRGNKETVAFALAGLLQYFYIGGFRYGSGQTESKEELFKHLEILGAVNKDSVSLTSIHGTPETSVVEVTLTVNPNHYFLKGSLTFSIPKTKAGAYKWWDQQSRSLIVAPSAGFALGNTPLTSFIGLYSPSAIEALSGALYTYDSTTGRIGVRNQTFTGDTVTFDGAPAVEGISYVKQAIGGANRPSNPVPITRALSSLTEADVELAKMLIPDGRMVMTGYNRMFGFQFTVDSIKADTIVANKDFNEWFLTQLYSGRCTLSRSMGDTEATLGMAIGYNTQWGITLTGLVLTGVTATVTTANLRTVDDVKALKPADVIGKVQYTNLPYVLNTMFELDQVGNIVISPTLKVVDNGSTFTVTNTRADGTSGYYSTVYPATLTFNKLV